MAVRQNSRLLVTIEAFVATIQGASMQVATSPTPSIPETALLSTSFLVLISLSLMNSREVVTPRVTITIAATLTATTIITLQKLTTSTVPLQLPSSTVASTSFATANLAPAVFPSGTLSAVGSVNSTIVPTISEFGQEYGNLIFRNYCPETLHLFSIGVRRLGGYRKESEGYGTPEDNVSHHIAHGETYIEPYRITCPDVPGKDKYCLFMDKVAGQGVAIKISRNENVPSGDIFQFEYALVKEPKRAGVGDKFYRMNYDISLLDCARAYDVTDVSDTGVQHAEKMKTCPEYGNGVAVSFDKDPDTTNCPPIYCAGE